MHDEPRPNHRPTEHNLHNGHTDEPTNPTTSDPEPAQKSETNRRNSIPAQAIVEGQDGENDNNGPPSKRRKLADRATRQSSTPRPISPPWKKVAVEGPTSFVENGRRKSSRTNFVPLELQPQADKRQTRARIQGPPIAKSKYGGASNYKSSPSNPSPTKSPGTAKDPHSSSHPSSTSLTKSPGKSTHSNGVLPKQQTAVIASSKRSHKKKTAPTSVAQSDSTPNPHQTRRKVRTNDIRPLDAKRLSMATDGWHTDDDEDNEDSGEGEAEEADPSPDPHQKPQRLNLRVRPPSVPVQHPENIPPARRFASFEQWINQDQSITGDNMLRLTDEDARNEADLRRRIIQAGRPGGLLSEGHSSRYIPDRQDEPPQQYARQDYMLAAIVNFHKLMGQERAKHKRNAKQVANLALAKWEERELRFGRGPQKSREDVETELRDACETYYRRTICGSLRSIWEKVTLDVDARRRERWHEEQQRLGRQELNKVLARSTRMLHKRREGAASQSDSDDNASDASEAESEFMSSSQSDSEGGSAVNAADDDEGLTIDELRLKYAGAPDRRSNSGSKSDDDDEHPSVDVEPGGRLMNRKASPAQTHLHEPLWPPASTPENLATDESDPSTNMDDDMGDSDEGEDGSGEGEESEGSEEGGEGLLGFFAKTEYQPEDSHVDESSLGDPKVNVESTENEKQAPQYISSLPDATQVQTPSASNSEEPLLEFRKEVFKDGFDPSTPFEGLASAHKSTQLAETTSGDRRPSLKDLMNINTNLDHHRDSLPTTPVSNTALKTPVPSLLRGTLREYQHVGLDWLAKLYGDKTNGILADEMGLGKTIQTIALLAHLAVVHEAWGPHLIVVPTSVMLNWEMEFKKFLPGFKVLTYYGSIEERRRKREGWMNDDKWNVWITSYALVVQDNQIFRKRNWHYMVLDEAHNIKNFRSQRWQTLLNFKTRARLLLTGTPLQNNLTELWSLLFFLMPTDGSESGIGGFADLQQFSEWFRKPVEQILEHGKETMDEEGKAIVKQLHHTLRPYLLRRLKADVEKQMPGKYEHVVHCRLSKRQRELYQGFLNRAETKAIYASGNHLSMMNCIMQLRKVCCHPDLFETRQIVTSFAMRKSAVADFEIKELLVRRRLLKEEPSKVVDLGFINLLPGANEPLSALDTIQKQRLGALGAFRQLYAQQWGRINQNLQFDGTTVSSALASLENVAKRSRFEDLRHASYHTMLRSQRRPLYSQSLVSRLKLGLDTYPLPPPSLRKAERSERALNESSVLADMVLTLPRRSEAAKTTVSKFACVTPKVVAPDILTLAVPSKIITALRPSPQSSTTDPYHEARMCLSIAFPDKRLLQYDCGKLQSLDALLRKLQAGGHRALVFTQMTKVLDVLEQFLNIHGHRYLRLDGGTKIEQRQILTERFNNDERISVFILSTRSGGLGINLTGADSVIFYDSDWNPAMDKQCQDRSHRIGQTRDVHIYRLVSESTVEINIMRRARQKTRLDEVVIQEGQFNTDHFQATADDTATDNVDDGDIETDAALDRVLGGRSIGKVFEQVEDKEDVNAAKIAEKEMIQTDAADFDEKADRSSWGLTPKTPGAQTPAGEPPQLPAITTDSVERTTTLDAATSGLAAQAAGLGGGTALEDEEMGHIDEFMLRHIDWELKDVPVEAPPDKSKSKKKKKGEEHRIRRRPR